MARQDGREDVLVLDGRHGFPFGLKARLKGAVRHSGIASPLRKTRAFRLTRRQVFGESLSAKIRSSPALPNVRPAPQAGCFVSGLGSSETQPTACRQPRIRLCAQTAVKLLEGSVSASDQGRTHEGWRHSGGLHRQPGLAGVAHQARHGRHRRRDRFDRAGDAGLAADLGPAHLFPGLGQRVAVLLPLATIYLLVFGSFPLSDHDPYASSNCRYLVAPCYPLVAGS
jgi:hypothetical protein